MTGKPDIIDPDAPVTVQDAANKGNAVIGGDAKAPAVHLDQEISDMTPGFLKKAGAMIGEGAQKLATALVSLDHSPAVEGGEDKTETISETEEKAE